MNPLITLAFSAGILVGVIAAAAAKTLAVLAIPVALAAFAGFVVWKRRKRNARTVS